MTVDWNKVGVKAAAAATNHEERKASVVVMIGNQVGRLLDQDPNHPIVEVVRAFLRLDKDADVNAALAKLGIKVAMDGGTLPDPSGPAALPPAGSTVINRPMPVFNDDGTPAGVALREDEARAAGYGYKLGPDGSTIVGWQKPPAPVAPAPTPAPVAKSYDVYDSKGKITARQVTEEIGIRDTTLEAVRGEGGAIRFFRQKRLVTFGKK